MLRPFLIRDLREDSQLHDIIEDTASDLYNATDVSVGPQRRHGLVQLAASDYDEIAYTNPQARLTYLDEDDGDIITIGSSFELAQRLDEPTPQTTDTEVPSTIHLFDIRRRQSITDLWKRFEHREHGSVPELADTDVAMDDLDTRSTTLEADTSSEQKSPVATEQTNTTKDESSASFLSAFEAEMAKLMNQPQLSESNSEDASSSRAAETDSPNLPRETAEAFASALRSLMEVAEAIRSGVKAKIPELERHLDSARRSLPSDITDSMRSVFQAVEAQVRAMASSINGIPDNISREAGPTNARLFSELPTPNTLLDGLREMSVQLGGIGKTLLEALRDSNRSASPAQYEIPYFNVLNSLMESSNQPATMPSDVGNSSSSHHGSAAESAANENTLPANVPESQPRAVPGFDQGSSESGSGPQHHSFYEQFPYRPPHQRPHVPRYLPTPHWPEHPFNHHPAAPFAPLFNYLRPSPSSQIHHPPPTAPPPPPPPPHDFSDPSRTLFIGNVGFEVTEKMIKDVFAYKGLNVEVKLPRDSRTMKHAGFGYVTFHFAVEASLALHRLQGATIDGHRINLETTDHTPVSLIPQEPAGSDPAILASAPQTSGVIRRDADDDTSASAPDSAGPKPTGEKVYDHLVATAEARFPPVSQLEARLAAKEHRLGRSEAGNVPNADETSQPREESATSSHIPGSFPQDEHDLPSTTLRESVRRRSWRGPIQTRSGEGGTQPELPGYSSMPHPGFPPFMVHPGPLHRAATARMPDHRRSFDPFEPSPGLRRRATERHSLRHGPHMGPMGPRHRASFHHPSQPPPKQPLHPTTLSAHEEESDNPIARRKAKKQIKNQLTQGALDECVARLRDMGFGTEEDGGPQRLSIYAAATNGDLFEAISMIEEEREAYNLRK